MIVLSCDCCLSVCVAWLVRVEEVWFVNSEDQELKTDVEAEVGDQKKEAKEF